MNETLLYKIVGMRLRSAREGFRPKLSQEKLAARIGLTRASLVNIEAGRQRAPLHVIYQLASELDVEPDQLLPRIQELQGADYPVHLNPEDVLKIEEAANGDPETHFQLIQFVSKAKAQAKLLSKSNR